MAKSCPIVTSLANSTYYPASNISARHKFPSGGAVVEAQLVERSPDNRDPRFESCHRQNFIYRLYNRKDGNKEKIGHEWSI